MTEPEEFKEGAPKYPPPQYPPPNYPPPNQPPPPPAPQGQATPYGLYQPATAAPSAYWPLTIIAFLMSCVIGGAAMFFSYQVGEKMKVGDTVGAAKASKTAMIVGIIGIVVGGLVTLAYIGSASK